MNAGWTVEIRERGKSNDDADKCGPYDEAYARDQYAMVANYPADHVGSVTLRDASGKEVAVRRFATMRSKGVDTLKG